MSVFERIHIQSNKFAMDVKNNLLQMTQNVMTALV